MRRALCLATTLAFATASAEMPHQRAPVIPAASAQAADQLPTLLIPYIPRAGQANEGFFSLDNYGDAEAGVTLWLYDEHGTEVAIVLVSLPAGTTRWLNSRDLTDGNPNKGVSVVDVGSGRDEDPEPGRSPSLWARVKASTNRVLVLAYLRSTSGFVTAMSRTAATWTLEDGRWAAQLPFFNPGSNGTIRSELRLVNPTDQPRTVGIGAWDSNGDFGQSVVQCTLGPYGVVRLTAEALEAGPGHAACTGGGWGDGAGKWFVQVEDTEVRDESLIAMALLHSTATGLVTNVSAPALTVIERAETTPPPPETDLAPEDPAAFFARVQGKKFVVGSPSGPETAEYRFTFRDSFLGHGRFAARFSVEGSTESGGTWTYTKGPSHQASLELSFWLRSSCVTELLFTTRNAGRFSAICRGDIASGDGTFQIQSVF